MSPVIYVCSNCGYVLFRFEKVGQDFFGPRTPSEIKKMYNGRCPVCGHELGIPSDVILMARNRLIEPSPRKTRTGEL